MLQIENVTHKDLEIVIDFMRGETRAGFAYSNGDALSLLKDLPSESIDLVITDPPYESLEKHRAVGSEKIRRLKSWFDIFPNARFEELFLELYRVLKNGSHCYVFCDQETMFLAKPIAEKCGFKFWKPIIWDKQKIGMGYHYRSRYECVLFFEKGKRNLTNKGTPDVLAYSRVFNGYPTEKPVDLCEVFVAQSSLPGEIVIDPFMGSGAVGVAALRNGRHFLGSDTSEKACELTRERCSAELAKKAA
jgi:site-specific DNA-methyltransferase (adenine-specific)